jgi:DNA-binding transcriptional MerR regulator
MSRAVAAPAALRIGELARRVGTTPRTIRYYEELGLLPGGAARRAGGHRSYTEDDVTHLAELLHMRELVGLSLEELRGMTGAEQARAVLRAEFEAGVPDRERRREILTEAIGHLDLQLALVARRQAQLRSFADDLRRHRSRARRLLDADGGPRAD